MDTENHRWWRASKSNNSIEHVTVVSETAQYVTFKTAGGTRRAKKQSEWECYSPTREEVIAWKRELLERRLDVAYRRYQAARRELVEFEDAIESLEA